MLIALVATSPRIRVAGEAAASVAPLDYLKTQGEAIWRYLALVAWPLELVFDYGMAGDGVPLLTQTAQWLPWGAPLLALIALAAFGVARNRAWAFAAAAFFLVLLPSSSIVPIAQDVIAEHRMYLPLAAVAVIAVCGGIRIPKALFRKERRYDWTR